MKSKAARNGANGAVGGMKGKQAAAAMAPEWRKKINIESGVGMKISKNKHRAKIQASACNETEHGAARRRRDGVMAMA